MCSFPHHVRLPALHYNAPQHITMYPDNHTVQKLCIVGMMMGGGMAHEKVYPKLSSGIIHGHLIALVRYKKPRRIFRMTHHTISELQQNFKSNLF